MKKYEWTRCRRWGWRRKELHDSIPAGNTYNKKEVGSISTQETGAGAGKKELAEQLWLSYYNQVLFEAG